MKAIHYDAEGDILSVTFTEANGQKHTGVELSDNIVLYYNPETEQPLKLILLSYQKMLQASVKKPIVLDGLNQMPVKVKASIVALLQRTPITAFLQLDETHDNKPLASRVREVFTSSMLQMVTAS
jgi:hypothetical protein